MILAATMVLQPDVVYLGRERYPALRTRGVEGPPTLVVDLDAHVIESYALREQDYELAMRVSGTQAVDLPPFVDLGLVPSALWP